MGAVGIRSDCRNALMLPPIRSNSDHLIGQSIIESRLPRSADLRRRARSLSLAWVFADWAFAASSSQIGSSDCQIGVMLSRLANSEPARKRYNTYPAAT